MPGSTARCVRGRPRSMCSSPSEASARCSRETNTPSGPRCSGPSSTTSTASSIGASSTTPVGAAHPGGGGIAHVPSRSRTRRGLARQRALISQSRFHLPSRRGYNAPLVSSTSPCATLVERRSCSARRLRRASASAISPKPRGRALSSARCSLTSARADEARDAAERAVADARAAGDELWLLMILPNIGSSMYVIEDYARARAALEEAIPLAEQRGAWPVLFTAQINLGSVLLWTKIPRAPPRSSAPRSRTRGSRATRAIPACSRESPWRRSSQAIPSAPAGSSGRTSTRRVTPDAAARSRPHSPASWASPRRSATFARLHCWRVRAGRSEATSSCPAFLRPLAQAARAALGDEQWSRVAAEGAARHSTTSSQRC